MFKQPKKCFIKSRLWCCHYQQRLLLRIKQTLVRTNAIPRKLFNNIWIHASRHIIINTDSKKETGKSWMGRGHWFTDICYNWSEVWLNFETETDIVVVMRCAISIELSTPHVLHCQVKNNLKKDFPDSGAFWWLIHVDGEPDLWTL